MRRWAWGLVALSLTGTPTRADGPAPVRETQKTPMVRTIYVPVISSDGLSRAESLRVTETLIKAIERSTPYKVVGSPGEADLIFEGTVKPIREGRR